MVLGVENLVLNAPTGQHRTQALRLLYGYGTDQDRPALLMQPLNLFDNGFKFGLLRLVDEIGMILPDHRHVGRNDHHVHAVDLAELSFFRLRRTCHAGQLFIHAEVILECDGSQGLRLSLDTHALLGFNGLVESVAVAAAQHQTSREFVNNDHLAVFDDIVSIFLIKGVGSQCLLHIVCQLEMCFVKHVDAQPLLELLHAFFGDGDLTRLFVDCVVDIAPQTRHQLGETVVMVGGFFRLSRDNQRSTGFIDQNVVHFVDDRVVQSPLYSLIRMHDHIVTQIVKPELIVRTIGDIAIVGLPPLGEIKAGHDATYR